MQNTCDLDRLAGALLDLVGFFNAPQRDGALLKRAGVDLDRALFPLLMRLGRRGVMSVAELADEAGRDQTTISRQLTKLDSLGLIDRRPGEKDKRQSVAELTQAGKAHYSALLEARRTALSTALSDWTEADRLALTQLLERFSTSLEQLHKAHV